MYKYFTNCKTVEEVKKMYHKLCMEYHPDIHGAATEETMKEINAEYYTAFENAKKNKNTATTNGNADQGSEVPEEFKNIINAIIKCDGLIIEIVGSWIWLTGNTFEHKETIKNIGFMWAAKKKAWYWHSPEETKRRNSKMSLEQIKEKYGSQTVKTEKTLRLA